MVLPNNKEERELLNRAELKNLLKEYKGILNSSMMDYLDSLIGLEFSVIRDYISDSDRKVLSELEIYKKVAIYNIYNRAVNLIKKENIDVDIEHDNNYLQFTKDIGKEKEYSFDDQGVVLFEFDYGATSFYKGHEKSEESKSMRIGEVSLYQTFENRELREKEMSRILGELEHLYEERKHPSTFRSPFGGLPSASSYETGTQIEKYEKLFTKLDNYNDSGLGDIERKEIEITGIIHHLLLDDYGLGPDDFVEEEIAFGYGIPYVERTNTEKTLVKKMPNLTIMDHIKYI